MNHWAKGITITAVIHLALCAAAAGQVDAAGDKSGKAQAPHEETDKDDVGIGVHFQVGAFYRFAESVSEEKKQTYLATGDLSWLRWSRTESSWGLGLHFAFDDRSHRLGVKGLWRTPLKKGTWMYFQLAPGIYVGATDDAYDPKSPGFFLEAELGLARAFALVVKGEVIPYKNRTVGYSQPKESGTATALFVGAKAGQEGAMAITVIAAIVGIVAMISFASSDGFI